MIKIAHFSDSFGSHKELDIPEADVLVFSGNIGHRGHQWDVDKFLEWFTELPHNHKIIVPGNYDVYFDRDRNNGILPFWAVNAINKYKRAGSNHFLVDEGCDLEGVRFWGSPFTSSNIVGPSGYSAFTKHYKQLNKHWAKIPKKLDILITHGPAYGQLDVDRHGISTGCEYLAFHLKHKKPLIHLFGHNHDDYGIAYNKETKVFSMNSSVVNGHHLLKHEVQCVGVEVRDGSVEYLPNYKLEDCDRLD